MAKTGKTSELLITFVGNARTKLTVMLRKCLLVIATSLNCQQKIEEQEHQKEERQADRQTLQYLSKTQNFKFSS